MSDTPAPAPVGASARRRRRDTILLAVNGALLAGAIVLFFTQGSGLTRWLLLLTCSLNTFNAWYLPRGRQATDRDAIVKGG